MGLGSPDRSVDGCSGAGRRAATLLCCALAALAAGAGCKKEGAPSPSASPSPVPSVPPVTRDTTTTAKTGSAAPASEPGAWYRAKLVFDGIGELPFFLHVPPVGKAGRAFVINGDETADFTAEWRDNEISINGPWNYTSVIEAQLDKTTHRLEGTWTRDTPLWGQVVRTFSATPIDAPDPRTRFATAAGKAADKPAHIAGTWKFQFAVHEEGEGTFDQGDDGVVRGFVKPGQLGDIRYLAGNLAGNKLSLSTFNGNAANLVLADISADGNTMSGMMSMQNVWNEKFTATRADASYHFANKVHLKAGSHSVTLAGLDKYKGKPTLAIIFATWCSSCNDAYPVFKQLYQQYHAKGLEVMGVAYDLTADAKANVAELDKFRARHQIPWELFQVPCTPETWAKAMPPEIEGWDGLPIVLLVRPDGSVQTVFGGWFGPATGAEGDKQRAWFIDETKKLVESSTATPATK